jgi:hypothetical protein
MFQCFIDGDCPGSRHRLSDLKTAFARSRARRLGTRAGGLIVFTGGYDRSKTEHRHGCPHIHGSQMPRSNPGHQRADGLMPCAGDEAVVMPSA